MQKKEAAMRKKKTFWFVYGIPSVTLPKFQKEVLSMKKLLTLTLSLIVLASFTGLSAAQEKKAEQKSQPTGVEMKQPATGEKRIDKASPILTKVTILEVNESAKTITFMAKGKRFTVDAKNLKSFPKPGEIISMRGDPTGRPGQRLVCHSCHCPPAGAAGPCDLCCFDYQPL